MGGNGVQNCRVSCITFTSLFIHKLTLMLMYLQNLFSSFPGSLIQLLMRRLSSIHRRTAGEWATKCDTHAALDVYEHVVGSIRGCLDQAVGSSLRTLHELHDRSTCSGSRSDAKVAATATLRQSILYLAIIVPPLGPTASQSNCDARPAYGGSRRSVHGWII